MFERTLKLNTMKIDLTNQKCEVFYKYIYPLFAKEFLHKVKKYEDFTSLVSKRFKLNSTQWDYILSEWELKEYILTEQN